MVKLLLQIALFILPWGLRRLCLCILFGFKIHKSARIGFSVVLAHKMEMGEEAKIGHLTFCRSIERISLAEHCIIGSLNFITGFSKNATNSFKHVDERRCELILGKHTAITSRHYIDCNGGVYVGEYTTVAGIRTQIVSHSIDIVWNRQDARPVNIGDYCFVGSGSILLPGSSLPSFSVLGAGSVLNKGWTEGEMLYAGTPARAVKKLDRLSTGYFNRSNGVVI